MLMVDTVLVTVGVFVVDGVLVVIEGVFSVDELVGGLVLVEGLVVVVLVPVGSAVVDAVGPA